MLQFAIVAEWIVCYAIRWMFTWIIWSKHDLIVNMPVDMSIDVAFLLLAFKVRVYKSDSSFSNRLCLLSLSFSLSVDFSFICLFQVQPHVYSDGSFRWTFDNIWLQNYCNKKYFRSCERIRDSPKWYHIVDLFLNFLICAKIFLKGEGTFFSLPFGCRGNQKKTSSLNLVVELRLVSIKLMLAKSVNLCKSYEQWNTSNERTFWQFLFVNGF